MYTSTSETKVLQLKIEYLREFAALTQYRSYTAAAEHLFITQPVLSRHIAALENELSVRLFHRNTQSVTLTDAGRVFAERVPTLLRAYDDAVSDVRLQDQGYAGELRIGLPYYLMNYYLGDAPARFKARCPLTKLSYLTGHPDQIIEALMLDTVDLLILAHMPFRYAESFVFHDLFEERYSVLLPRSHRLARCDRVEIADLEGETFLGVESSFFSCTWAQIKSLCRTVGFSPGNPVKHNQLESVIIAIQQGAGIIIEGTNLLTLASDNLVTVPLVGEGCSRTVSIVTKAENKNPALPLFVGACDRIVNYAAAAFSGPAESAGVFPQME